MAERAGFSDLTITGARQDLWVQRDRDNVFRKDGAWWWKLPEDAR